METKTIENGKRDGEAAIIVALSRLEGALYGGMLAAREMRHALEGTPSPSSATAAENYKNRMAEVFATARNVGTIARHLSGDPPGCFELDPIGVVKEIASIKNRLERLEVKNAQ